MAPEEVEDPTCVWAPAELVAPEDGIADTGAKWLLALETHSHRPSYRGLILMASAGMVANTAR